MPTLSRVEELRILRAFIETGSYVATAKKCSCHRSTVANVVVRCERELAALEKQIDRENRQSMKAFLRLQRGVFKQFAAKVQPLSQGNFEIEMIGETRTDKNGKSIRVINQKTLLETLKACRELRALQLDLEDEPAPMRHDVRVSSPHQAREQAMQFMRRHSELVNRVAGTRDESLIVEALIPTMQRQGLIDEFGMPIDRPFGVDELDGIDEE